MCARCRRRCSQLALSLQHAEDWPLELTTDDHDDDESRRRRRTKKRVFELTAGNTTLVGLADCTISRCRRRGRSTSATIDKKRHLRAGCRDCASARSMRRRSSASGRAHLLIGLSSSQQQRSPSTRRPPSGRCASAPLPIRRHASTLVSLEESSQKPQNTSSIQNRESSRPIASFHTSHCSTRLLIISISGKNSRLFSINTRLDRRRLVLQFWPLLKCARAQRRSSRRRPSLSLAQSADRRYRAQTRNWRRPSRGAKNRHFAIKEGTGAGPRLQILNLRVADLRLVVVVSRGTRHDDV